MKAMKKRKVGEAGEKTIEVFKLEKGMSDRLKHRETEHEKLMTQLRASGRVDNVQKFNTHQKEANSIVVIKKAADEGLQLHDLQLQLTNQEGTQADLMLFSTSDDQRALGLQCKSTEGIKLNEGRSYFQFREPRGYEGLIMLLTATIKGNSRFYVFSGDLMNDWCDTVQIPLNTQSTSALLQHEVKAAEISDILVAAFQKRTYTSKMTKHLLWTQEDADRFTIKPRHEWRIPTSENYKKEYYAKEALRPIIPFEDPEVEHGVVDAVLKPSTLAALNLVLAEKGIAPILGGNVQFKSATPYKKGKPSLRVNLMKNSGRQDGKETTVPYDEGDWHVLIVSCCKVSEQSSVLCREVTDVMVIPMQALRDRGIVTFALPTGKRIVGSRGVDICPPQDSAILSRLGCTKRKIMRQSVMDGVRLDFSRYPEVYSVCSQEHVKRSKKRKRDNAGKPAAEKKSLPHWTSKYHFTLEEFKEKMKEAELICRVI
jgi:hypothetical protein